MRRVCWSKRSNALDKAGLLPVIRTATNQRRIPADAFHSLLKGQGKAPRCAVYARVSSAKQERESNLTRQAERLRAEAKARGYQVETLSGSAGIESQ